MLQKCVYCGSTEGIAKGHIIPKSFLKHYTPYDIFGIRYCPALNIVPVCSRCSRISDNRLYLPTRDNMLMVYSKMPTKYLQSIAEWTYLHKDSLLRANLGWYGSSEEDVEWVSAMYKHGYYDRLTQLYGEDNPIRIGGWF